MNISKKLDAVIASIIVGTIMVGLLTLLAIASYHLSIFVVGILL